MSGQVRDLLGSESPSVVGAPLGSAVMSRSLECLPTYAAIPRSGPGPVKG